MRIKRTVAAIVFGLLALAGAAPAWGLLLIDPNFFVCETTDPNACGADPNAITGGDFYAFTNAAAGLGPLNPFLLFAAIPNSDATPEAAPTIASAGNTVALASGAQFGQSNTPVSGYLGELSASSSANDLYGFAGVPDGNASFNSPNMSGLDPGVTSFSIYEFVVTIGSISNPVVGNLGDNISYLFTYSGLADGSYLAAYGVERDPLQNGDHVYDSAFTVGGRTGGGGPRPQEQVPEPGMLGLLSLGLLALSLTAMRRRQS